MTQINLSVWRIRFLDFRFLLYFLVSRSGRQQLNLTERYLSGSTSLLRGSRLQLFRARLTQSSADPVMCCGSRIREPHTASTPGTAHSHAGERSRMSIPDPAPFAARNRGREIKMIQLS